MKHIFTLIITVFSLQTLSAQSANHAIKTPGRTQFYAELGGPGILFSANMDTRFKKSSLGWGGRVGIGFVTAYEVDGSLNDDPISALTLPVQVNYVFGKAESPHTFEVGAGITYVGKELEIMNFYDDKTSQVFGTASFMYRRQPVKGGFTWRIGFTPLIAKGYIQASGGVSIGYSF